MDKDGTLVEGERRGREDDNGRAERAAATLYGPGATMVVLAEFLAARPGRAGPGTVAHLMAPQTRERTRARARPARRDAVPVVLLHLYASVVQRAWRLRHDHSSASLKPRRRV